MTTVHVHRPATRVHADVGRRGIQGIEQEARFLHPRKVVSKWGAHHRDPHRAAAWGVQDLPAAYLIDQEGLVAVHQRLRRAHLGRDPRRVLQE